MADPSDARKQETIAELNRAFSRSVPHNRALGLELVDYESGWATMRLPYSEKLVGDPQRKILHGGAITSLMDATCGAAAFLGMRSPRPIATLDLRIDYLKPATPGEDVLARAELVKCTQHVAFVRATAFHGDVGDPIATAAATFMVFDRPMSGAKPPKKTTDGNDDGSAAQEGSR